MHIGIGIPLRKGGSTGPVIPNRADLVFLAKSPLLVDSIGVSSITRYFSAPGAFGPDNSIYVANYLSRVTQNTDSTTFATNVDIEVMPDGFTKIESNADNFQMLWQLTTAYDITVGKRYAVRANVRNPIGTLDDMLVPMLTNGTGSFTLVSSYADTAVSGVDSVLCFIVDCTASGTLAFRTGINCFSAKGTHPTSAEVGHWAVSEIASDATVPPPYVPPQGTSIITSDISIEMVDGFAIETDTGSVSWHKQSSVMCLGDSFTNDYPDWPRVMQDSLIGERAVYYNGVGGRTLAQIIIDAPEQLNLTAYNRGGAYLYYPFPSYVAKPGMVVIGAGINDVNTGATYQDMVDRFNALNQLCFNAGVTRILWFDLPPWKGYATWTQGKEDVRQAWNTALPSLVAANSRLELYKLSETLGDTDPLFLLPAYDNGDGLHPNETGMAVIAADIAKYVKRLFSFDYDAALASVDSAIGGDILFDSANSNAPFERTYDEWYNLSATNNPYNGRFNISIKAILMYGVNLDSLTYDKVQRYLGGSASGFPTEFVTTWITTTNNETITLPLRSGHTYDFYVDWGDGAGIDHVTAFDQAEITHEFALAGDQLVTITGSLPAWYVNFSAERGRIKTASGLGSVGMSVVDGAFFGCSNLTTVDTTGWVTSTVTNFALMFKYCPKLTTIDTSNWDTSAVTNFQDTFRGCTVLSAVDSSNWDVSLVTDFAGFMRDGGFSQTSVDGILAACVAGGKSGAITLTLSGGTSSPPSAEGLADKATLEGRGWTVTVNV